MLNWREFVVVLFLIFTPLNVGADDTPLSCPDSIAVIEGSEISQYYLHSVQEIYLQLGCRTRFIEIPGQRGIVGFNHGVFDGEFIRISSAETNYTREFVRSAVPVGEIKTALWLHPDQRLETDQPIGFQLGVEWEKRYASQLDNALQFYSAADLFDAYRNGDLSGFLASYINNDRLINRHRLSPEPTIGKALPPRYLYHYLAKEFEPLMQQISKRLAP